MCKKAPVRLLLASSFVFSSFAWSNELNQSSDLSNLSLDQVMSQVEDKKGLMAQLEKAVDKICAPLDRTDEETERQREIADSRALSRLRKEFARYSIKFDLGDFANIFNTKYFAAGANYQYVVEPAFRNNEQIRKDIWTLRLGVANPAQFTVGASTVFRFTFTRFYGGKDAKWNAIKACPYFVSQAPMNTNQVKSKLRSGDGFRFEIIGNNSLTTDRVKDERLNTALSASVKTEALFLVDFYKLNEKTVRTRFLGIKNKGETSVGFSVKNDSPLSFIKGRLRDALTLGLSGALRKTVSIFSPKDEYPLDTLMVDYLFNFSTPDQLVLEDIKARTDIAESALEELMTNIRRAGFISLFFSAPGKTAQRDQDLANKLLEKAKIAEDISKEDIENFRAGKIEAKDIRVRRLFKGRMQSDLFSGEGRFWFSGLFSKNGQIGSLDSFVTSFDENMAPRYYFLNNTFERSQTKKYFGRENYNYSHDFDLLINTDQARTVGKISDVVIRTEIRDTDLSLSEINEVKTRLTRSLPDVLKNDDKFKGFFPTADQTNGFLSHRLVFGHEAFASISQIDTSRMGQMMFEFLETHPERKFMHLEADKPEAHVGLGTYSYEKATEITNILSPLATNEESLKAFKIAQRDPIFDKYIVGEFFASIIPEDNAGNLLGVNLKASSTEIGKIREINLGNKTVSPVYEAVAFLKAVISDPSLDMQMIGSSDPNTGNLPVPATGNMIPLPQRKITTP